MKPTCFFLLMLAAIACAAPQTEDELHIPMENDNLFPPDNNLESDALIDGSGAGAVDQPLDVTTTTELTQPPLLEDVQQQIRENVALTAAKSEGSCPKPCVCHIEGESNDFVVDCSGYGLTEFPTSIDTKTTILNIQNNKLTEIPKDISLLSNLKILNVNDNSIQDLASGSVSELLQLTVLKLGNNRLIEYPMDLKNGFLLTKLEELDLGGNDMRTPLQSDIFSHFKSLKKLTMPASAKELVEDVCTLLKNNLLTVCIDSCTTQLYDCPEAPEDLDDGLMNVSLPGTIAFTSLDEADLDAFEDTNADADDKDTTETSPLSVDLNVVPNDMIPVPGPYMEDNIEDNTKDDATGVDESAANIATALEPNISLQVPDVAKNDADNENTSKTADVLDSTKLNPTPTLTDINIIPSSTVELDANAQLSEGSGVKVNTKQVPEIAVVDESIQTPASPETNTDPEFTLRSAVNKASGGISPLSTLVETPKETVDNHREADVTVGATTSGTKTGGVDKNVIGIIVAGMVLVVAGITIKKNWSSIKNKFSSSPRPANERPGTNANGTTPEEVPLQEKSPV